MHTIRGYQAASCSVYNLDGRNIHLPNMRLALLLLVVVLAHVVDGNNTTVLESTTPSGELYGEHDDDLAGDDEGTVKSHAGDIAMGGLTSPQGDSVEALITQFNTLINHPTGKKPDFAAAMNKLTQTMVIVMKSVVASQNTTSAEQMTTAGILGNVSHKKATPELTEANSDPFNLATLQAQFSELQKLQAHSSGEQEGHVVELMKQLGEGLLRVHSILESGSPEKGTPGKVSPKVVNTVPRRAADMDLSEEKESPKLRAPQVGKQFLGVMKSLGGQLNRMEKIDPKSMKKGLKARLHARLVRTRHLLQDMGVLDKDDSLELPNDNGDEAFVHLRQNLKNVVSGLLNAHTILPEGEVDEATTVIKRLKERMDSMEELHGGSDRFAKFPKLAKVHSEIQNIMDRIAAAGNQLSPEDTASLLKKVKMLKGRVLGVSERGKATKHRKRGMDSWEKVKSSVHTRVMNVLHELKTHTSLTEQQSQTYLALVKGIQEKLADVKQHGGTPSKIVQQALQEKVLRLEKLAKSDKEQKHRATKASDAIQGSEVDMDERGNGGDVRSDLNAKLVQLKRGVSKRTDMSDSVRANALNIISSIESKAAGLSDSDLGEVVDNITQMTSRMSKATSNPAKLGDSAPDIHALHERLKTLIAHLDPSKLSPDQAQGALTEVRNLRAKVEALKGNEGVDESSTTPAAASSSAPTEQGADPSDPNTLSDDNASALREKVEAIVAHLDTTKMTPDEAKDALALVKKIHSELNAMKESGNGDGVGVSDTGTSDAPSVLPSSQPAVGGQASSSLAAATPGSVEKSVKGLIESVKSDPNITPHEAEEALTTVKKMKLQLEGVGGDQGVAAVPTGQGGNGGGDQGAPTDTSLEEIKSKVKGLWEKIRADPSSVSPSEASKAMNIVKKLRGELGSYGLADLHEQVKPNKKMDSQMLEKIQSVVKKSMKEIESGDLSDEDAAKALEMVKTLKQKLARLN